MAVLVRPVSQDPMHFFSDNKDILIILLVKLGIVASLSALLARSLKFKKTLYAEPRGFQEKLNLVLYWGVPLAIGVAIRNGLGFPAFDLTLEGTFIAGLLGGNVVGLIVGCSGRSDCHVSSRVAGVAVGGNSGTCKWPPAQPYAPQGRDLELFSLRGDEHFPVVALSSPIYEKSSGN